MKKLLILSAFVLLAGVTFGQTLQKGSFIGFHIVTVDLKPRVSMDQYVSLLKTALLPAYEKEFKGLKLFLLEGVRGENKYGMAIAFYFKSMEDRNKYFKEDGSCTELGKKAYDNLVAPIANEIKKLGTMSTKYTDWIVQ